ncbi:MAG TPA: hypothetical protein HPP76_04095 [Desulfuromonadales bacterium]|nr:hypothetical protein [Desulfuromonadales bacterium]
MKKQFAILLALLGAMASESGAATAAGQTKTNPYPHYWMSLATSSQSMPGMSSEMAGMAAMFGGASAFGPRRDLKLQLESPRTVSAPEAFHDIPPVLNMGNNLPLKTPRQEKSSHRERELPGKPEQHEKTRIRMLYYWGCGDNIGPGQPRVFDSEKSKPEDMATIFKGAAPSLQTPPAPHNGWTFGEWPSAEDRTAIPKEASLVGEHRIRGNYTVDIPFRLDTRRDFMEPVKFSSFQQTASGGTKFEWQSIPTAIGYFATAVGSNGANGDIIMWSASEIPENGMALMDYLTPGDVSRFIRDKIIIDPSRTSCTVPPIFKDSAGAMLQFIAYGEQLDIVHPPRPKDPKVVWQPEWSVKVRLKSTSMAPLGVNAGDGEKRKPKSSSRRNRVEQQGENPPEEPQADRDEPAERRPRGEGVGNALRGIFGF